MFSLYDFDESTALTLDEMVLAFRSSLSGVGKITKINPPSENEIEAIIIQAFTVVSQGTNGTPLKEIDKDSFLKYCLNTPEVVSWIEFFDDLEEFDILTKNVFLPDYSLPSSSIRSNDQEIFMNPDISMFGMLDYERGGRLRSQITRTPWQNAVQFLAPAKIPDSPLESPPHNISLEWVYGYNGHSSRQNASYTGRGEVLYPAGAVCVLLNVQHHSQRFYIKHKDTVSCLKSFVRDDGKTIVGTGEFGKKPSIHIWDSDTLETLSVFKGFHSNGISQLDFSPNRKYLASIGMDVYHSVAVYDCETSQRVFASRSTTLKVYDLRFLSNDIFSSCGENHVIFWKNRLNTYKMYKGMFGSAVKPETLCCVAMVGNTVVTGSMSGMIYIWEGRNLISSIKGHSNPVYSCFVVNQGEENGLVTACSGGKIQIWNSKIEVGATFNAVAMGPIDFSIISVCWDLISSKLLIGFRSCELFEMDATDGRNIHRAALVAAHFNSRVCGISTHPFVPKYFCSVGDDKTIRVFDAIDHKQLRVTSIDTMAHCCTYTPDGQMIIVGLGSGIDGKDERKEGGYIIVSDEDLTLVHESRDSKFLISDCKCSQNGSFYALASYDGSIYLYNMSDFKAKSRCRGHTGQVTHIDISTDGKYIMSNSSTGELLFWDVNKGEIQAPRHMKEIQWETNSCVFSYSTQGIWGPVDNNLQCHCAAKSHARDFLISVDNFGRVRAFNSPAVKENPNYVLCGGHGADVMNCQFACDDSFFLTSGGSDGCIFQWRVVLPEFQDYSDLKKDESLINAIPVELKFEGKALDISMFKENIINDRPIAVCEMEEGIYDSSQMLPWQRTIVPPSKAPIEDHSEPSDSLELEFIYGFTADRSRESISYLPNGEILFFCGTVAVIMTQKSRSQRFYQEHNSTITSLGVGWKDSIVATGDLGPIPVIRIWNPFTLSTLAVLQGFHRRGIAQLRFSPNGKFLASIGQDEFHSVAIYDWRNNTIIAHCPSFTQKSLWLEFNPLGTGLLHLGNESIRFYEFSGKNIYFQEALLGRRAKLQGFLCSCWLGNNAILGTSDGNIYRFVGRQLDGVVLAHSSSINSIQSSHDEVCSASSDGFVKIWTHLLECRLVVDMRSIRSISPVVRCLSWHVDMGKIIIGTALSEIFEVNSGDGDNMHLGPLLEGHGGEELWGLSFNTAKEEFCTVGDDALLRVWDIFKHNAKATIPLEMAARCCAYSPDGRSLAIGFGCPKKLNNRQYDGKWIVLETNDYQITHEARDSTKWITDIKYAPSGEFVAMGSFDFKIYVYNIFSGYSLSAVIGHHQAPITALDFSDDSAWIQSNCSGMELCFFETDTGMFIPAASRLRDTKWSTQNCSLGWAVQGIWPPYRDGTECTACECNVFRGSDGPVVACGDNYGRISLFRYPCTSSFSHFKRYKVSSSSVPRLRFACGDSILLSVHGSDKIIAQWSHKRDRDDKVAWNLVMRKQILEEDDEDVMSHFGILKDDQSLPAESATALIATRPWISSMVSPSSFPEPVTQAPSFHLFKSHIIGIQSQCTRGSVRWNCRSDVIYPSFNSVCVFNKKSNFQIFYDGHEAEVSCICVSRDGKIVASADRSKRSSIHIWDSFTASLIIKLPFFHRRGVCCINFSSDRKRLVTVGMDQDHSIALWESPSGEWSDGRLLAWSKGDVNPVLFCTFYEGNAVYSLVSGGRFHQKFWTIDGRCLNSNYGEFDDKQKIGTLLSGACLGNNFVSGSTSGHLYVWIGRKLDRVIRAHELGVSSIFSCSIGLITGSKDGMIKLWSLSLEHIRSYSLGESDVPPMLPKITSIDASLSEQATAVVNILVSTSGGEIYEVAAQSGSMTLIQEGHFRGELWGLCVHPTDPDLFVTCGDDNTVRMWSISKKRLIRKALLDSTARCVSWSEDGRNIIVGLGGSVDGKRQRKDGAFLILDAISLKPLFEGRYVVYQHVLMNIFVLICVMYHSDSRHWIRDVKFSPDNKTFAVASMDHKIYIYNRDNYRLKGSCDRHNSHVQTFDYSIDSVYIQSDSGDYEHLYFESEDGQYFSAGSRLKDIQWHEWTCTYGWPVQGIFLLVSE